MRRPSIFTPGFMLGSWAMALVSMVMLVIILSAYGTQGAEIVRFLLLGFVVLSVTAFVLWGLRITNSRP